MAPWLNQTSSGVVEGARRLAGRGRGQDDLRKLAREATDPWCENPRVCERALEAAEGWSSRREFRRPGRLGNPGRITSVMPARPEPRRSVLASLLVYAVS